jgi:hypothetical protein
MAGPGARGAWSNFWATFLVPFWRKVHLFRVIRVVRVIRVIWVIRVIRVIRVITLIKLRIRMSYV